MTVYSVIMAAIEALGYEAFTSETEYDGTIAIVAEAVAARAKLPVEFPMEVESPDLHEWLYGRLWTGRESPESLADEWDSLYLESDARTILWGLRNAPEDWMAPLRDALAARLGGYLPEDWRQEFRAWLETPWFDPSDDPDRILGRFLTTRG